MAKIKRFSFFLLLVSALMLPTSAYAYDTSESGSQDGFLQTFSLSTIFSFFNKDYQSGNYQDYSWDKDGNHDRYDDDYHDGGDWWDDFCKWWNGGGHDGGGDHGDDDCWDNKGGSWGNDDGCLDSAEIWKKWYCW